MEDENKESTEKDEEWLKEIQNAANEYANQFFEEERQKNPYLPEEVIKARLSENFIEACSMSDLNEKISTAIQIIHNEGCNYLDPHSWNNLKKHLDISIERLHVVGFDPEEMSFQELLGFDDETLSAVETIARKKFQQKKILDSLALYSFLSTVKGDHPVFWLRLGIVLQENNEFEKAIRAYDLCREFDPQNIGAELYSAECHIALNNKEEASNRATEAFRLINEQLGEERWLAPLKALRKKLK